VNIPVQLAVKQYLSDYLPIRNNCFIYCTLEPDYRFVYFGGLVGLFLFFFLLLSLLKKKVIK
jgi:hypothetical protein